MSDQASPYYMSIFLSSPKSGSVADRKPQIDFAWPNTSRNPVAFWVRRPRSSFALTKISSTAGSIRRLVWTSLSGRAVDELSRAGPGVFSGIDTIDMQLCFHRTAHKLEVCHAGPLKSSLP